MPVALFVIGQVILPGTQPNELVLLPEPSSTCGCHDSFNTDGITEPGETYRATLMANAGRDPIFRAALNIANQDRPDLTDLCLRCHTPMAWLAGRSEPGDGSLLTTSDLESVTCDICHRMVPTDPPLIGSGQITLAANTAKRAQRGSEPFGGHGVVRSDYQASSDMCGTCHSLFNPAEEAHGPQGTALGFDYYEQRTFEEWRDSAFPGRGETCISCHMTITEGAAVNGGEVYSDLPMHNFVGGNHFAIKAVQILNPAIGISGLIGETGKWIDESLRSAADLEIVQAPGQTIESGEEFDLKVRITNKTGHKLPTGYPEGRRVYLEVSLIMDGQQPQVLTGAWDPTTGNVAPDVQLVSYETEHGRFENGVSQRTRRLLEMNQVLNDTRIPPEGFVPGAEDMVPFGLDFGDAPPYRHYHEPTWTFTAPDVSGTVTATIAVRAMYQATDGYVVDFLINASQGSQEAEDLQMVWDALAKAPPGEMARVSTSISFKERVVVANDAGTSGEVDTGIGREPVGGGCACSHSTRNSNGSWLLLGILGLGLYWRRR